MDFGIARAMGDSGMTMTQTAAVIGTAQYLSPEQAKGEQVDARSDLYSTGCLLYELLTVRPPFVGDSPVAVAYQHVREEPQPPSDLRPRDHARDGRHRPEGAGQGPGLPLPVGRRDARRHRGRLDGQPVAATAAMGAVGYGGYDQTTSRPPRCAPQDPAGQTSMLPADEPGRRRLRLRRPRPGPARGQKKRTPRRSCWSSRASWSWSARSSSASAMFSGDDGAAARRRCPTSSARRSRTPRQLAATATFKVAEGGRKPCDNARRARSASQDPAAGSEIDKNDTITGQCRSGAAEGRRCRTSSA